MNIHVWQHVPFEGPAFIAEWAHQQGLGVRCIPAWEGPPPPPDAGTRLVAIMGGPMSIHDEHEHPWLIAEKQRLREVIASGLPVLGVCLGAQMIADVLGAAVTRNAHREIGWFPVKRDEALAPTWLGASWPVTLDVLHWHGETFAIPKGAVRIAGSAACANQGFLYGDRIIGLQCHLETTAGSLEALISHCANELDGSLYVQSPDHLREGLAGAVAMQQVLARVLDGLLAQR